MNSAFGDLLETLPASRTQMPKSSPDRRLQIHRKSANMQSALHSSSQMALRSHAVHGVPSQQKGLLSCGRAPSVKQAAAVARCRQTTTAALDEFSGQSRRARGDIAAPARVFAPTAESMDATSPGSTVDFEARPADGMPASNPPARLPSWPSAVLLKDVTQPVAGDMDIMNDNLMDIVTQRGAKLRAAADLIFKAGGKKLRPAIVLLVARATAETYGLSDITPKHRRLAEIIEMIHTASLVHDDVLDECDSRRGKPTVNKEHGNRMAVLVGDFLFAQSSYFLAHLEQNEVIKLISEVIANFADGEIKQAENLYNVDITMQDYLDKSFYKTASLIAASCRSSAIFSGADEATKTAMFEYGRHLGLAFQIVDDILDFTRTTEQLGKPQGQDLASGNLTAPVLFALQHETVGLELADLIDSEFNNEGGVDRAMELVTIGGGIAKARDLARSQAEQGLQALAVLKDCEAKQSLQMMVSYVLERLY